MMSVIGAALYSPQRKSKNKSQLTLLHCRRDGDCPLLKERGQCMAMGMFGTCIFGHKARMYGRTRRARSYHTELAKLEEERKLHPGMPKHSKEVMAVIGPYVWLPYPHMNMCEAVPFKAHGGGFARGINFVPIEAFTAEAVVTLSKFRPYAMMGGVITKYQKDSVPQFLYHLRRQMPSLYGEALMLDPSLDDKVIKPEAFANTPVAISHVLPGTKIGCNRGWHGAWDGQRIVIEAGTDRLLGLYSGHVEGPVIISFVPAGSYPVLVEDEDELLRLFNEGVFGEKART